jgi:ribA/ribD-fused uncharacterized protein
MKHNMRGEKGNKHRSLATNDAKSPTEVRFYRASEKPYGAFSNLFRRQIILEDRVFPTAEHAYQAGKARKKEVKEWILSAPTPALVAMAGHGLYTWDIVPAWSRIKFDRMRKVLRAKFTQHDDLRALLLSTREARIVEVGRVNNAINRTWGEINGKGRNMLGILLMELRTELRKNESSKNEKRQQALAESSRQTKELNRRSARPGTGASNRNHELYAIQR